MLEVRRTSTTERTTTMSAPSSRREFLSEVGRGMLVAGIGLATATDLGLAPAWADDDAARALVRRPRAARRPDAGDARRPARPGPGREARGGTELRELVAAAALANARTFGGEDYVGFHTMMALAPAFHMARELPDDRGPCRCSRCSTATPTASRSTAAATRRSSTRSSRDRSCRHRRRRRGPARRRAREGHERGRAAPSPCWPRRRPTTPSTACSRRRRTTPRSTAWSCRTGPGTCSA